MIAAADRLDLDRIEALYRELEGLARQSTNIIRRTAELRQELAELLDAPRSPEAGAALGKLLQRLGAEVQP